MEYGLFISIHALPQHEYDINQSKIALMCGMVSSSTNPHYKIMQYWWYFLIYHANVVTASISISLSCFKAGMFGLTNIIPKSSFNDQMFTTPTPPFLTFSNF